MLVAVVGIEEILGESRVVLLLPEVLLPESADELPGESGAVSVWKQ